MKITNTTIQIIAVCILLSITIFSVSSCTARETEAKHKYDAEEYKFMNPLERCINGCPVFWSKDKECVDRCFKLVEKDIANRIGVPNLNLSNEMIAKWDGN